MTLLPAYLRYLVRKFFKAGFVDFPSSEKIDVVIPTTAKDSALLEEVLSSLRRHLLHPINKIYIVSPGNRQIETFCREHACVFVDEISVLGYGKDSIQYQVKGRDRSGWIYQQLLKLAGERYVEMRNYLVIDSDTLLINPHSFIKEGKWIYLESDEWFEPYSRSFQFLLGYPKKGRLSYTSHMMIFNTAKVEELQKEIETRHRVPWDQAFIKTIDENEFSCVSEYDIYANWILHHFPEQTLLQPFYNISLSRSKLDSVKKLHSRYGSRLKSLSFHSYLSD